MKAKLGRDTVFKVRFPQLEQADIELDRGVKRFELNKNWESNTIDWSTSFLSAGKRSPHYSNFFRTLNDNARYTRLFPQRLPSPEYKNAIRARLTRSQLTNYSEPVKRNASVMTSHTNIRKKMGETMPVAVMKKAEKTFGVKGKNMHRMIELLDDYKLYDRIERRRPVRLETSHGRVGTSPIKT